MSLRTHNRMRKYATRFCERYLEWSGRVVPPRVGSVVVPVLVEGAVLGPVVSVTAGLQEKPTQRGTKAFFKTSGGLGRKKIK